jgi:hypothetical protein
MKKAKIQAGKLINALQDADADPELLKEAEEIHGEIA